jgi:hypothetical protein
MRGQLAAEELDGMWDKWSPELEVTHRRTLQLLDKGEKAEAYREYRDNFHEVVKVICEEAEVVAPARFSSYPSWSAWLRHLNALSAKTTKALRLNARKSNANDKVAKALERLREHFYKLALKTKTRKCNDYIYAFYKESMNEEPDIEQLKKLRNALEHAAPSIKAKADQETYQKARQAWSDKINPLLADSKISPAERKPLRNVTESFLNTYGIQVQ